jgi:hypothetical protein
MKRVVACAVALAVVSTVIPARADPPLWGRLANPGFENQPIKSAFFFTGNWRNGVKFYEYNPSSNVGLYTIHPSDSRHLKWSESAANRAFAVDTMVSAGINVVNMSYWGPRGTDNWAYWAPMQTSTYAHDELFQAVLGKDILIAPYIEDCAATAKSPGFAFKDSFPGSPDNPAPALVERLKDLIDRYILHPQDRRWTPKWAQVYDRSGQERYLVCLIAVASNQEGVTDQRFAEAFDQVADRVYEETGVRIGFAIDAMPSDTYVWARFLPSPEKTGPWLVQRSSILAIQCYFSGHSIGVNDEETILRWKQRFASKWINTGIPFVQDISPGYDAHIVFPGPHIFGNTDSFRSGQSELIHKLKCQGVTFTAWNGYTEGYAGVPTAEYGDASYLWACDVFRNFTVDGRHPLAGVIEAEDYEQMSGVQKEIVDDDGGGFDVTSLDTGDWLDYKVAVPAEEEYVVRLRTARSLYGSSGEGQIRLGSRVLATLFVPGTGGPQNWKTVQATATLPAGEQTLRLYVSRGGWSLNWLEFRRQADLEYHDVPGRIEAEDYDDMYGVKTEVVFDDDAGFNTGQYDAGDWLDYLLDVNEPGEYNVAVRVALADGFAGGTGQLRIGSDVLWTFGVPVTGGWQDWETITGKVNLTKGRQTLRVQIVQGPWNLNWLELTAKSHRLPGR